MDEYIKLADVMKAFEEIVSPEFNLNSEAGKMFLACRRAIITNPTADVVEVKHGEWTSYETEETYGDDGNIWYKCSICGTDAIGRCYDDEWYSYPIRTDYCPKCGADLRTPKERGGEK